MRQCADESTAGGINAQNQLVVDMGWPLPRLRRKHVAMIDLGKVCTDPKKQTPNTRDRTHAGVRARIGSDATARARAHAHM